MDQKEFVNLNEWHLSRCCPQLVGVCLFIIINVTFNKRKLSLIMVVYGASNTVRTLHRRLIDINFRSRSMILIKQEEKA